MDKIVFNILTCNRFYYFKNCIESVFKFVDLNRIKILVCDNCTVEKGFDEYLEQICKKYGDLIEVKKFDKRVVGEVYRAMNYGIKYSRQNKFSIINFVQDDYQYLFRNDKHLDDAWNIYKNKPKIAQCQFNLVWLKKHKKKKVKFRAFEVDGTVHARLKLRPCDNGFTRVDVYDKTGLYPGGSSFKRGDSKKIVGEDWFGSRCKKKGYRRSMSFFPNIGMVYDTAFVRGSKRYGNYFPPPNEFYLRPLSPSDVSKIKKNHDKNRFSFIEKICIPDGWTPDVMYKRNDKTKVVNSIK